MRDCTACRWFVATGEERVNDEIFVLGECNRPEGPLDPRTTRAQVRKYHGHTITHPAGMKVEAATRLVSTGMGCKAFEGRGTKGILCTGDGCHPFETDVTQVTAKDDAVPDLFGNSDPQEGP